MLKKRPCIAMFLCIAAAAFGHSSAALADGNPTNATVTVGAAPDAPPFSYIQGGKFLGISNDILRRVGKLENLDMRYQQMAFDGLIPALQVGQLDIAVSGIFITKERQAIVDFSTPYFIEGALVIVPVNSGIKSLSDLKGNTIACEQGSAALKVARQHAPEWGVNLRILQDPASMQLAMRSGDVAAMIYDSALVSYQLRVEGAKPTIKIVSPMLDPTGIAFAFPKGSKWVAVVNRGIAKLKASGELDAIAKTYNMN
ncbi:transporter substrate-binding domain-containing protein [Paraburkholderia sprentiae WSM5005]|uniref:Transporter substrate-binding domain-containing protein n=1 Tax=Paraburkholderia sprentiae WSM5005 TaxID=754502 RepID=A0A1I9YLI8_9BURK|nr:ABC transporter substrate-binding protein [Paraburkholderia sprentiae]APA87171.2 transporter substrate-binding domain-containing protein [Paraburkholderia sprentiae WSM5005]